MSSVALPVPLGAARIVAGVPWLGRVNAGWADGVVQVDLRSPLSTGDIRPQLKPTIVVAAILAAERNRRCLGQPLQTSAELLGSKFIVLRSGPVGAVNHQWGVAPADGRKGFSIDELL